MTLGTLILMIGAIALVLTMVVGQVLKQQKSALMTFLQNFTGSLFIFSGWVKAIDPLGTAYKMEQYFAEFEYTFGDTWMSFLAPMFPWLSNYSIGFSVFMIVFEIVLGIMLLLGARPKLTSWAFLILVGFFTFLTGFTYLTGYVPSDVNFFEIGKWGPYVETNMKVTDCGCFGDFLKLKPKISFFKDLFLLIPAFYFVFRHKDMHQLFSKKVRTITIAASTLVIFIYCLSNYSWDLPHTDFRPFAVGVDVRGTLEAEQESEANVQVLGYKITNIASKEVVEMNYATFLKEYKNYPKEEWEYEQVKSEPEIEATKISDFDAESVDGNDMTEEILNDPNYSFMIVSYKLYNDTRTTSTTVNDTTWVQDSIVSPDTIIYVRNPSKVTPRTITETEYLWDKNFQQIYKEKVNPLAEAAEKDGYKVYAIVGGAGGEMIESFRHGTQTAYPFYMADDILLKTIVRSNPGVVLLKDGKIIQKWHHKKLPGYEEIKAKYLK
jgi:uncharacterized membrane protein YphA (DoxX/SURF4 family)